MVTCFAAHFRVRPIGDAQEIRLENQRGASNQTNHKAYATESNSHTWYSAGFTVLPSKAARSQSPLAPWLRSTGTGDNPTAKPTDWKRGGCEADDSAIMKREGLSLRLTPLFLHQLASAKPRETPAHATQPCRTAERC